MALHTRLTEMLGIEHPVMLAGMGGVSYHRLVAALSEAGGYGCFGASTLPAEELRAECLESTAGQPERRIEHDIRWRAAREIERMLNLPIGWLDLDFIAIAAGDQPVEANLRRQIVPERALGNALLAQPGDELVGAYGVSGGTSDQDEVMARWAREKIGWAHTKRNDDTPQDVKDHINQIYDKVGLGKQKL